MTYTVQLVEQSLNISWEAMNNCRK